MKLKHYYVALSSAGLALVAAVFAGNSGFGPIAGLMKHSENNEETEDIRGAYESFYSMRLNEKTGTLEPEWVMQAVEQADRLKLNRRLNKSIVWESMGPDNVGGRIRAFLLHRDSAHLMFAGGVSGGLFRSNTFGQSWYPVNDLQENLNVTCIGQTTDGTIYYGTGEGGYTNLAGTRNGSPAFIGGGVFKSTNSSGTSFVRLPSTNNGTYQVCNAIITHLTDPQQLWVATDNGLYHTLNGGTSWTLRRGGAVRDVAQDKNGVIYASLSNGAVYKSNTDGTSFGTTPINNTILSGGRTAVAVSPEDPNYIYLLASSGGALAGVYRSTDGGANWERIVANSSVTDIFGSNRQGWYDNVITVDPQNKNRVYMGGVTLAVWDTNEGFREMASTFDAPWNTSYVHADKHIITFNMRTNPITMIVGSDGGLHFSQDRATWTPRNRGFVTYQAYNVAANELGHVAGGSQDNGTQLINFTGNSFNGKPSQNAISIYGGDGFDIEFSKFNPKTIFVSTYYGRVARTGNSGQSSSTFFDDRQDGTVQSDFNTTFTLWEKSATESRLFLAKNADVWVAVNPTDFTNDVNWFLVSQNLGTDRIIEMDHTPDGDHLFVCKAGRLFRIDSLNAATYSTSLYPGSRNIPAPITTVNITPAAVSGRTITSVNVNPENPNHVVITLGGYGNNSYVYESTNALDANPTFSNITGNLPSMPVYDAVIDVDDANRIVIGTELGVWVTENGGTSWEEANSNGMARVPVFEIRAYEWRPWEGMSMYLGTHGRGFFKSTSLLTNTKSVRKQATVNVAAYPNPAASEVNIDFSLSKSDKVTVDLYSINGKFVSSTSITGVAGKNSVKLNVAALTNGYYFARVNYGSQSSTVKFSVNK